LKHSIFPALLVSILICSACASTSDKLQSLQPVASEHIQSAQLAVEVKAPMDGLPDLAELPDLERSASATTADYFRKGSEIATPGSKANAITLGDSLIMGPNWDPNGLPPTNELSWGIYGYHLPGYDRGAKLDLSWAARPDSSQYYIAVSDFGNNRWRWFQAGETDSFDFGSLAGHFSSLDTIYFAVLLTGTGSFELTRLRLGGNFAPTASFIQDSTTGKAPHKIFFDASASSDPDGSIVSYDWSFENPVYFDAQNIGATPNWTYDHVASYTCTLRVIDNEGASGEATSVINITGEPVNMPPTAVIVPSKSGGQLPQGIVFDAFGSTDPDDIIVGYRWDLDGDGYFEYRSNGIQEAYREFIEAGTTNVGVMVIDFFGAWDTDQTEIVITPVSGTGAPTAVLSLDYYCLQSGINRVIDTSGCTDPDNDIVKYEWDFEGDGTFDYDNGLYSGGDINYTLPGNFTPTLRITDSGGRQAMASLDLIASNTFDSQESEPNNDVASADSLGGFMNYAKYIKDWKGDLAPADKVDWYEIDTDRAEEISIWADFDRLAVDLNIELYEAADLVTPLAVSSFGDDRSFLHLSLPVVGKYFVKVFIPSGAIEEGPASYLLSCVENHSPVADLQGAPALGAVPFDITFDATGSFDADESLFIFDYDLNGDGIFETINTFDPNYVGTITETGSYNVGLRVTDSLGETAYAYLFIDAL
jgi:hypothetical protein